MVWFRVDDSLHSHPKFMQLSAGAIGVWTKTGSWCSQFLTDGQVPGWLPARLFPGEHPETINEYVRELQTSGLWTTVQSGHVYHDWSDFNPTKQQVTADRNKSAARIAKSRQQKGRTMSDSTPELSHCSPEVLPSRPVPTRPDPRREEEEAPAPQQPAAAAASNVLPFPSSGAVQEMDGELQAAIRGFRWWQDKCGLEPWSLHGKWKAAYAALGAMPADQLHAAAKVLLVAGQRPGGARTAYLRPDHVLSYWPLYSKGLEPGQRVELPSQETPGAKRIRTTRERHAAEILGRRAGSPEGLSYDLDIMRARHEMELSGTIAAVERDGNMRGGAPSRIRYG